MNIIAGLRRYYEDNIFSNRELGREIKRQGWEEFGIRKLEVFESINQNELEFQESSYISKVKKEGEMFNIYEDECSTTVNRENLGFETKGKKNNVCKG